MTAEVAQAPARLTPGQLVSRYAKAQGMTLVELARRTGKPVSTVYAYSCGARQPKATWVAQAWAELGHTVRPSSGTGDPPPPVPLVGLTT